MHTTLHPFRMLDLPQVPGLTPLKFSKVASQSARAGDCVASLLCVLSNVQALCIAG